MPPSTPVQYWTEQQVLRAIGYETRHIQSATFASFDYQDELDLTKQQQILATAMIAQMQYLYQAWRWMMIWRHFLLTETLQPYEYEASEVRRWSRRELLEKVAERLQVAIPAALASAEAFNATFPPTDSYSSRATIERELRQMRPVLKTLDAWFATHPD